MIKSLLGKTIYAAILPTTIIEMTVIDEYIVECIPKILKLRTKLSGVNTDLGSMHFERKNFDKSLSLTESSRFPDTFSSSWLFVNKALAKNYLTNRTKLDIEKKEQELLDLKDNLLIIEER